MQPAAGVVYVSCGAPALTYGYDPAGRLLTVQRNGAAYASATYDPAGRLATRQTANNRTLTVSYDGADRPTALTYRPTFCPGTCLPVAGYNYSLTRGGQVSGASDSGSAVPARSASYGYDGLQRLSTFTETLTTTNVASYSYDAVGNRQTVGLNGKQQGPALTYDAADQVVGWSYDGAGNLLGDGSISYSYNALNQLTSSSPSLGTLAYSYNGDGALATETQGATTTRYLLDPTGGQAERLSRTSAGTTTVYLRGWGAELADETGGTASWAIADRLGSVRATTDPSGSITAQYSYDAWGTPTNTAAAYGFTGEPQTTAGGGLLYLRARWYRPGTGRFLTTDPYKGQITQPMSMHPYMYTYDNPVNFTDPSGYGPDDDYIFVHGCVAAVGSGCRNSQADMQSRDEQFGQYAELLKHLYTVGNWGSPKSHPLRILSWNDWAKTHIHVISASEDIKYAALRIANVIKTEIYGNGNIHLFGTSAGGAAILQYFAFTNLDLYTSRTRAEMNATINYQNDHWLAHFFGSNDPRLNQKLAEVAHIRDKEDAQNWLTDHGLPNGLKIDPRIASFTAIDSPVAGWIELSQEAGFTSSPVLGNYLAQTTRIKGPASRPGTRTTLFEDMPNSWVEASASLVPGIEYTNQPVWGNIVDYSNSNPQGNDISSTYGALRHLYTGRNVSAGSQIFLERVWR